MNVGESSLTLAAIPVSVLGESSANLEVNLKESSVTLGENHM